MDFSMPWGTTKTFGLVVTDQDNQPVSLIGKTLICIAKNKLSDADTAAVFKLTVNDGITVEENSAVVKISPSATHALSRIKATSLHYQCLLIEGDDRFELQSGKLNITPSAAE